MTFSLADLRGFLHAVRPSWSTLRLPDWARYTTANRPEGNAPAWVMVMLTSGAGLSFEQAHYIEQTLMLEAHPRDGIAEGAD